MTTSLSSDQNMPVFYTKSVLKKAVGEDYNFCRNCWIVGSECKLQLSFFSPAIWLILPCFPLFFKNADWEIGGDSSVCRLQYRYIIYLYCNLQSENIELTVTSIRREIIDPFFSTIFATRPVSSLTADEKSLMAAAQKRPQTSLLNPLSIRPGLTPDDPYCRLPNFVCLNTHYRSKIDFKHFMNVLASDLVFINQKEKRNHV